MRPGAVALLAIKVLNEGGESVEFAAGGVPANENFAGVGAKVKGEHLLLIVHVDLYLFGGLGMGNGVAVPDFDFSAIFAASAEEGTNDAVLVLRTAERVIEDGEYGL